MNQGLQANLGAHIHTHKRHSGVITWTNTDLLSVSDIGFITVNRHNNSHIAPYTDIVAFSGILEIEHFNEIWINPHFFPRNALENAICKMSVSFWGLDAWINCLPQQMRQYMTLTHLPPGQNGHHFADDIFKYIFWNEKEVVLIKISKKFIPNGPISNIPGLAQIMAWRRPGGKPLLEPMLIQLTDIYMWQWGRFKGELSNPVKGQRVWAMNCIKSNKSSQQAILWLTLCGLVMPCGDKELNHHWQR